MTQLLRVSAFQAKNKLSFHAYEELIMLLFAAGVDVGDVDHSRMTAREMNEVVAGFGRGQLKAFLELTSPITGHLPHLGVAADTAPRCARNQNRALRAE